MFFKMTQSWFLLIVLPCALSEPRVIVDLTEDIDLFKTSSDIKAIENIATALSYSPNFYYRTDKPLETTGESIRELFGLIDKVCKGRKGVECDVNQVNIYFGHEGFVSSQDLMIRGLQFLKSQAPHPQFKSLVHLINGHILLQLHKDFTYQYLDNEHFKTGLIININETSKVLGSLRAASATKTSEHLFISVPLNYPEGVPESFPLFQDYFSRAFSVLKDHNHNFGAWEKFHLVISLNFSRSGETVQDKSIKSQYENLILKFVNQLTNEKNISVVISGIRVPSYFTRFDFASQVVIGRDIYPVTDFFPFVNGHTTITDEHLVFNGEFAPAFKNIFVYGENSFWHYMNNRDLYHSEKTVEKKFGNKTFHFLVKKLTKNSGMIERLSQIFSSRHKLGNKLETLFIGESEYDDLPELAQAFQVNIERAKFFGDLEKYTEFHKSFSNISENVTTFLIAFDVSFEKFLSPPENGASATHYLQKIQTPLTRLQKAWSDYQSTSSKNHTLIIHLDLKWNSGYIDEPSCRRKAYCNSCISTLNQAIEAILIWAKFHDVNLVIKTMSDFWKVYPGWYDIVEEGDFRKEVLVPRCQPLRLVNEENACIEQTLSVPPDGIKLSPNLNGVTINSRLDNAQGSSGGVDEMRVMTQFALNRFSLIEILLVPDKQCTAGTTIQNLLTSETFRTSNKSLLGLFFDFSFQSVDIVSLADQFDCVTRLIEILEKSVAGSISRTGIHLSNWENIDNLSEHLSYIKHSNIWMGLTVENCITLRNTSYNTLNSTCVNPLKSVDYIVCLTEHQSIEGSNKDLTEASKHLESNLYQFKVFQKVCPKVQVYFRLTSYHKFQRFIKASPSDFLTFIGDYVKFSEKYQIPLFLAEVIDRRLSFHKTANGWWSLTTDKDIANPKSYIEKEAEHLKKTTWRPKPEFPKSESKPPSNNDVPPLLAIILFGALCVAVFVIVIVWVKYLRTIQRLVLSQARVNQILNGESHGHDEAETSFGMGFQPNFKYDKKFEIAMSQFDFRDAPVLGAGFFGKVYKLRLRNECVAVKAPNPSCPEQGLISMLEEIKILCHVGNHEHVLRFIGCSTKSASQGKIYIATELCENGCLKSYLTKKLAPEVKPGADNRTTFNLLNQFSFQIASGMEHIASRRIIHSDLATRNVLLDSHLTCKIGDFGLSRKLYGSDLYEKQGQDPMPWRWMAVESLQRREYSTASDVWSFGITIWEIFSLGGFPYFEIGTAEGFVERLEKGLRLTKPEYMSDTTFDKIRECWNKKSCNRPDFTSLKQFFQGASNDVYTTSLITF